MQIPTSMLSSNFDSSVMKRSSQPAAVDLQSEMSPVSGQPMDVQSSMPASEPAMAEGQTAFAPVSASTESESAMNESYDDYVPSDSFSSSGNPMADQYLQVASETPMSLSAPDPSIFGVDEYV